jgi:hypothetical protein
MDDKDSVRGALAVCDRAALNRVNEADLRQCALEAASTGCAASCKKVVDLVRGLLLLRCPGTDHGHWETGGNRRLRPAQPTTGSLLQKCALFLPHLPPLPPLTAAAPTTNSAILLQVGKSCVDEVVRLGAGNDSDDAAEAAALRALFASC